MSGAPTSALWLSIRVSVLATLTATLVGIPLAYLLATRRFRGRQALDALVLRPLVLPPTGIGYYLIPLLEIEAPHLVNEILAMARDPQREVSMHRGALPGLARA